MRVLIVASSYPTAHHPYAGAFVRKLVHSFVNEGVQCTVINPYSVRSLSSAFSKPTVSVDNVDERGAVEVHRIPVVSLSTSFGFPTLGSLNPYALLHKYYVDSICRYIDRAGIGFDAVYGHFLAPAGISAVAIGDRYGVGAFVGVGEGRFHTLRGLGQRGMAERMSRCAGFIAVSTPIATELSKRLGVSGERVGIFPNGVELSRYKSLSRSDSRAKYGVPEGAFVVGAVGSFNHNKGINRVAQAISGMQGVVGLFAGTGALPPVSENTLFSGAISPSEMPAFLAACDVFVLPTLIEGCCNAIIEAMAAGLPVISSIGDFNDDLLDESMSIRVDPLDIKAIASSIRAVNSDDVLRSNLARASLEKSARFDIGARARAILQFMECRMRKAV